LSRFNTFVKAVSQLTVEEQILMLVLLKEVCP